jgi:Na+/H+ antiporter NhaD/arsenite permease-like protein
MVQLPFQSSRFRFSPVFHTILPPAFPRMPSSMHDTVRPTASHESHVRTDPTLFVIGAALAAYALATLFGWPQYGRDLLVQAQAAHHAPDHHPAPDAAHPPAADHASVSPPLPTVLPFVLLLAAIAVLPLTPQFAHWWEHNSSKLLVAGILGLVTLAYYTFFHRHPVDLHFPAHATVAPAAAGPSWSTAATVLANAMLSEYVPFIVLLFALYCITGGVRIEGDLQATPTVNASFLGIGGLAASFIGTTGAAMLLVRPLLETNKERRVVAHTLVFFIFMVCNCGGCLLPIGDPPLFLGYLEGVDFLWTLSLWKPWLVTNGILLAVYWLWDTFYAQPRERTADIVRDVRAAGPLKISGLWPNALLLAGVIAAVALLDPSKPFPGTSWHPWIYLREAVLLALVGLSLLLGSKEVRRQNGFSYGAILEVAALFLGIFVCMQPALALLNERGASLGIDSPRAFFWATGSLSSVLDNAPTYLVFFKTAQALPAAGPTMAGVEVGRLAAISLGAVFLGAMTYIGNGPNFMVKAIAEQSGVKMPSFFGYMLYSFGVLLPIFALVSFLFL